MKIMGKIIKDATFGQGNRKMALGIISIIAGVVCHSISQGISEGLTVLIVGVYGLFILGNIGEHFASQAITEKEPLQLPENQPYNAPTTDPDLLHKIASSQETANMALTYIVDFVKRNDPNARQTT